MSFLAVHTDDLASAAALSGRHGDSLDEAARLVVAAGRQGGDGLGPESEPMLAALAGYVQVESTVADALSEATGVLTTGLVLAGSRYAATESAVTAGLARGSP